MIIQGVTLIESKYFASLRLCVELRCSIHFNEDITMVSALMQEFQKEMGIEGSLKNESGNYTLPLDENLEIKINSLPAGFLLLCNVATLPQENREALFMQMLHGNLFGLGTKGAVLGINNEENQLTLSQAVEYTLDYKEFKDTIEDFINTVDYWREIALGTVQK